MLGTILNRIYIFITSYGRCYYYSHFTYQELRIKKDDLSTEEHTGRTSGSVGITSWQFGPTLALSRYSVPQIEIKMEFLLNPYNVMICCIYYNSLMCNF